MRVNPRCVTYIHMFMLWSDTFHILFPMLISGLHVSKWGTEQMQYIAITQHPAIKSNIKKLCSLWPWYDISRSPRINSRQAKYLSSYESLRFSRYQTLQHGVVIHNRSLLYTSNISQQSVIQCKLCRSALNHVSLSMAWEYICLYRECRWVHIDSHGTLNRIFPHDITIGHMW